MELNRHLELAVCYLQKLTFWKTQHYWLLQLKQLRFLSIIDPLDTHCISVPSQNATLQRALHLERMEVSGGCQLLR